MTGDAGPFEPPTEVVALTRALRDLGTEHALGVADIGERWGLLASAPDAERARMTMIFVASARYAARQSDRDVTAVRACADALETTLN